MKTTRAVVTVMCFGLNNGPMSLAEPVCNRLVNAAMLDTDFVAAAAPHCI